MPMDRGTPDLVRHCVAAVAKQYGGDTSKAFAICVAQLQKNGYLKPGTMELTAAGKAKEKEHEAEPDAAKKLKAYEKLLKANRKEEATADFDRLMNPTERSGFEDAPRTVVRKYESITKNESSMDTMRRLAGVTPRHSDRRVAEAQVRWAPATRKMSTMGEALGDADSSKWADEARVSMSEASSTIDEVLDTLSGNLESSLLFLSSPSEWGKMGNGMLTDHTPAGISAAKKALAQLEKIASDLRALQQQCNRLPTMGKR